MRKALLAVLLPISLLAQGPAHYIDAQNLTTALLSNPANVNVYDADGALTDKIEWNGDPRTAISVCSTFVTILVKHTYGYTDSQFKTKFGASSPTAARYYDDIAANKGFARITSTAAMVPGDIIAIKYPSGLNTTGHVMMVQSVGPYTQRQLSNQNFLTTGNYPNITGYYDITVIDSTASYHGPTDSRYTKPGGIGRDGIFRIYVDAQLNIVGYTWSTLKSSEYKAVSSGYLVGLGRLN